MRPSEDVWRRLRLPGVVVTWLVRGDDADHGRRVRSPRAAWPMSLDSPVLGTAHAGTLCVAWYRSFGDRGQARESVGRPAACAVSSKRLS
jgi:hypothetical protein